MGFIFTDSNGREFCLNKWSWGAACTVLREAGVLDEQKAELLMCNFRTPLDRHEIVKVAEVLAEYHDGMTPGAHLTAAGTVTDTPEGETEWNDLTDAVRAIQDAANWSISKETLAAFIGFLAHATPPIEVG